MEKARIIGPFRFELTKVAVPAVRERMVASLVSVCAELAVQVAADLGISLPKVLAKRMVREVAKSSALLLMAFPGGGGIRTRTVAILAADGVHGASITTIFSALAAAGAAPCVVAPVSVRSRPPTASRWRPPAPWRTRRRCCSMRLCFPMVQTVFRFSLDLARRWTLSKNQHRHGRTMLAVGASKSPLDQAGIAVTLPSGGSDPGIVLASSDDGANASAAFIAAAGKHLHPTREKDAQRV